MVGASLVTLDDFVWSFLVEAQLAFCRVSGGCRHFLEHKVSHFEMPVSNVGVVVLNHEMLVMCHLLSGCCSEFIEKVQL